MPAQNETVVTPSTTLQNSLLVMGSMNSSGSSFCVGSSGPSPPMPATHNRMVWRIQVSNSQEQCTHGGCTPLRLYPTVCDRAVLYEHLTA